MDRKAVSPVIAIVLLLMMTVAAAGAAYFWLTQMQSGIQEQSTKSIENIMQKSGRRLMAQAAICEPTAPEGMVAWYEFYEGSGDQAPDSSENSNNGTIYGPSWVDGKVGNALRFDDSENDYVDLPDIINGLGGDPSTYTVSYWTYHTNLSDHWGYDVVLRKNYFIETGDTGTGTDNYRFRHNGSDYELYSSISEDTWTHFTIVWDGSNLYLYKNGNLEDSKSGVTGMGEGGGYNSLGTNWNRGARYLEGKIDEVRFYSRALSAEEINETYKGKMKVKVTVRNIGSVSIPEAEFVANLKKDGTTVDSDTYVTTSSIDTGDLKTLTFYFNEMRPDGEYNINIPGIGVSQTVNCQSLES